MKRLPFITLILLLTFSTCKKYEDGPFMSIHTKQHRLLATWYVHAESEDGVDNTSNFQSTYLGYTMVLDRGGNYTITYEMNAVFNYGEVGTWNWNSDKTHVLLTKTSSGATRDWEILELREKEMKIRYTDETTTPSKVIEITFTGVN